MTRRDKIILILLSIITLGIYPCVVFSRKKTDVREELSVSEKVKVDIPLLVETLGFKDNIVACEYAHTKVKIFFKDPDLIKLEEVEKIKGISGVFITSKYVTIIVGNSAKSLATNLISFIS